MNARSIQCLLSLWIKTQSIYFSVQCCIFTRYWWLFWMSSWAFTFLWVVVRFIKLQLFFSSAPVCSHFFSPFIVFDLKFFWSRWGLFGNNAKLVQGSALKGMCQEWAWPNIVWLRLHFVQQPLFSLHSINLFQLISQSASVQLGAEKHRLCSKSQPQEDLFTSNS